MCIRFRAEVNTVGFIYKGELFYKTIKDLEANKKLYVSVWLENSICTNFKKDPSLIGKVIRTYCVFYAIAEVTYLAGSYPSRIYSLLAISVAPLMEAIQV